jgi:hypothetical protein
MKSYFLFLLFALPHLTWGREFRLEQGRAEYVVSHLVKTVKGVSTELKGKMICANGQCEFLVAIPVKSFISSDSNRDSNMLTVLEAARYPLITVKGELTEADLRKESFEIVAKVLFHGVENSYKVRLDKQAAGLSGSLVLLLESHKVERPSLLTVAIQNEVPVLFSLNWIEEKRLVGLRRKAAQWSSVLSITQ